MAAATRGDHVGAARNFVKAYGPEGRSVTGYGLGGRKPTAGDKGYGGYEGAGPGSADLKEMKEMEDMKDMRDMGDMKEPGPEVQT